MNAIHQGAYRAKYFCTVGEDGKSKTKVSLRVASGEDSSWLKEGCLLIVSSCDREGERRREIFLYL